MRSLAWKVVCKQTIRDAILNRKGREREEKNLKTTATHSKAHGVHVDRVRKGTRRRDDGVVRDVGIVDRSILRSTSVAIMEERDVDVDCLSSSFSDVCAQATFC